MHILSNFYDIDMFRNLGHVIFQEKKPLREACWAEKGCKSTPKHRFFENRCQDSIS
jgi:hypothetical protein